MKYTRECLRHPAIFIFMEANMKTPKSGHAGANPIDELGVQAQVHVALLNVAAYLYERDIVRSVDGLRAELKELVDGYLESPSLDTIPKASAAELSGGGLSPEAQEILDALFGKKKS